MRSRVEVKLATYRSLTRMLDMLPAGVHELAMWLCRGCQRKWDMDLELFVFEMTWNAQRPLRLISRIIGT